MAVKIAINGFGRIGRSVLRVAIDSSELEIVAVNDQADAATLAHLLQYDSVHGPLAGVGVAGDDLLVRGRRIRVCREADPGALPWHRLGVELAIEATGRFTWRRDAARHLDAGAGRVVISAPGADADLTVCMGVNEGDYVPSRHRVVSNASCTTNCLAPVAKVLLEAVGIVKGQMTTVHTFTNGQALLDRPHPDLRRARAVGATMIPTSTGAAKAVALVLPALEGKLSGMAIRVPAPQVSLIDLVVETAAPTTAAAVNAAFARAAAGPLKGILDFCSAPLVSGDFKGCPASATVDAASTRVVGRNLLKVLAWYDNEWGYSNRIVDLVKFLSSC
jgi:glyceraldehyde 3-phosphate dehydrogenase (phosphorylating)